MRHRGIVLILLVLIPLMSAAEANAAQFDAVLEFRFADLEGNLVSGACLFGTPIWSTFSVCDNQSASDLGVRNAASDEDATPGIIRVSGHYSGSDVSMEYQVSRVPYGYRVVLPTNGVFTVDPVAGLPRTYVVKLEPITSTSQEAADSDDGVCLFGADCQGDPGSNAGVDRCKVVELYPGYPGYRGVVPGLIGAGDTACLADLEQLNPGFAKEAEDAANEAVARQLGVQGNERDWTWETWMAIGAMRGYGNICFFCLMMDSTIVPLGPGVADGTDPRMAMPLRPAVATYSALGGDTVPNPELLLDSWTDRDWDRVRTFFFRIESLPTATALVETLPTVQSALSLNIDVVSCKVGERGGYALVPPGVHDIDQMWMYALGELGMAVSGGSPLQQMISQGTVSNVINAWALDGAGLVSLAEYVRSTFDYSMCNS